MTIDTACSGSLVSLDVACKYLQSNEISGAIVAGCNLYLRLVHPPYAGIEISTNADGILAPNIIWTVSDPDILVLKELA